MNRFFLVDDLASVVFPIARLFTPILDLNRVFGIFDAEGDLTDKFIATYALSDFGKRFLVPKIRQSKLCHVGIPLTGEAFILEGFLHSRELLLLIRMVSFLVPHGRV